MRKKKPTLKSEIARVEGIFTQNILDLSRRIDGLKTEALENDQDVNNLRTKLAKLEHAKKEDDAGVLALVKQVKELQKARGYGTTMEEMVNKKAEELQAGVLEMKDLRILELEAAEKRLSKTLCEQAREVEGFKEMEATWKRVAEERLREIEQLRSDDTDLREDLDTTRKGVVMWQKTAEGRAAEIAALRRELISLQADLKAARARYFSPFQPGCE